MKNQTLKSEAIKSAFQLTNSIKSNDEIGVKSNRFKLSAIIDRLKQIYNESSTEVKTGNQI